MLLCNCVCVCKGLGGFRMNIFGQASLCQNRFWSKNVSQDWRNSGRFNPLASIYKSFFGMLMIGSSLCRDDQLLCRAARILSSLFSRCSLVNSASSSFSWHWRNWNKTCKFCPKFYKSVPLFGYGVFLVLHCLQKFRSVRRRPCSDWLGLRVGLCAPKMKL